MCVGYAREIKVLQVPDPYNNVYILNQNLLRES